MNCVTVDEATGCALLDPSLITLLSVQQQQQARDAGS